jgi:hypothetical protein
MRSISIAISVGFVVAGFVSACGSSRTTYARYPNASVAFDRSAQDPKALEVADKAIAAVGGADKWAKAKQLKWDQSIIHDGKEVIGGVQAWDRWNGRHHGRARREGGDLVVIRELYGDTQGAFIDTPQRMKKLEGGADEAIRSAAERWEFDTAVLFMPFLMEEPGAKLEYVEEAVDPNNNPVDIIRVSFDPKDKTRTSTYRIVVARDTGMILRYEIQKAGAGENERLGYEPTQWSEAGGIKYPGSVKNLGLATEVITYKDMTVGDPDESLYIPPPLL